MEAVPGRYRHAILGPRDGLSSCQAQLLPFTADRFRNQSIATGILTLPELADGFGGIVQPVGFGKQGNQFDGAKAFRNVGIWSAQWPKFPGTHQNDDSFDGTI